MATTTITTATFVNSNITFTAVNTVVTGTILGLGDSNNYTVTDSSGNNFGTIPSGQFNTNQIFTILSLGGTYIVAPEETVTDTYAANLAGVGQTFDVGGNLTLNSTVAGVIDATIVDDGGNVTNNTNGTVGTIFNTTLENNGTYTLNNQSLNGLAVNNVNFTATGGTLNINNGGSFLTIIPDLSISGFDSAVGSATGAQNTIIDGAVSFSSVIPGGETLSGTPGGDQKLLIATTNGTQTIDLGTANFTNINQFTFVDDGGELSISVCFLRGTHIATPDGEAKVEDLHVGDQVSTRVKGEIVFQPITWLGNRRVDVSRCKNPQDSYPVRIRANAFGDNIPHRDLLITAEHCIFLDGKLIPARMLVNGHSIIVDRGISAYEYFHIELENHSILVSEGLETESYLDTGNRGNFANASVPFMRADFTVDAGHKSWETHAAAPLAVDRQTVEPIWDWLRQRALDLGMPAVATKHALINDPDLHLLTETGWKIAPTLVDGKIYTFVVPGGTQQLHLASRASRPSDAIGPFLDDRRKLGVLVGQIGLSTGRRRETVDTHLSPDEISGWYALETNFCRWTDGDAALSLNLSAHEGRPVFLDIEVISAGPYLTDIETAAIAA